MTQDENLRDSVDSTEAAVSRAEEARRRKASHARSGEAEVPPTRRAGFHPLAREPKSTVQIGDVRYYDGAELSRPLETPPRVRAIMLAAMVVAAVIGCLFLGRYFDQIMNEPIRQQQTLQENLAREVSYDFPLLSAGDAVKLLKGAWTLTVSRTAGDDLRLRYADFASGTIEKAVQRAMQVEGLENAEVTDSGVDDSGNTYQAGVVSTDNGTYNWRVSVIELDEVYDISGLPNTAFYVGIRFTAQA